MFTKTKNIDTAFRYSRMLSIITVIASFLFCGFVQLRSSKLMEHNQSRIYVLANGKALEAFAADRKENIPVEAKDHVKTFHVYFFTLDPDEKFIQSNITKALYMADGSAKQQYANLKENGYYANIISGNISQSISIDSVSISMDQYPYYFRCYATQEITRTSSTVFRSLVTEGYLRNVNRTDNIPHGFLIERWATLENKDIKTQYR
ncbi:MAG: conjugative transposon protein TraK [Sphingobacteriales bacterium]|nr:conjugative transposon protein TraK [Sphingobacteriales bacterium]OJW01999.1 MAG: conjugative transposon protein TraK [Sphingobacteriales bacterium 44-61]